MILSYARRAWVGQVVDGPGPGWASSRMGARSRVGQEEVCRDTPGTSAFLGLIPPAVLPVVFAGWEE